MAFNDGARPDQFVSQRWIRERAYATENKLNARKEIWRYIVEMETQPSPAGRAADFTDRR